MTLSLSDLQGNPVMVRVVLPWIDSRLLPNRKLHWAEKGRATSEARHTAWAIVMDWRWHDNYKTALESCTAHVRFCPPDRRKRDLDNLLRSIKPYFDGIVDTDLLKDDSCIRQISVTMGEPDKHNPRVEIELVEV